VDAEQRTDLVGDCTRSEHAEPRSRPAFTEIASAYDELMNGVPYDVWARYVEALFARHALGLHSGGAGPKLLDLACGTGNFSFEMERRGYHVVGVDISESMIRCARQKARLAGSPTPFHVQDACMLCLPGERFDACVSVFDSLNNILEPARLLAAFRSVAAHLVPGGLFVFDLNSAYALRSGFFDQEDIRADAPVRYIWRSSYSEQTRICTIRMRFWVPERGSRRSATFEEVHTQFAYEGHEVMSMLREAGFANCQTYAAYTFDAVSPTTDRVFYVASARAGENGH